MNKFITKFKVYATKIWIDLKSSIRQVSIDGINWTALIALQCVLVPTLSGLMLHLTDATPPIDMVLILWGATALFYIKAILEKNVISLLIIGLGFMMQSIMMALIFFK